MARPWWPWPFERKQLPVLPGQAVTASASGTQVNLSWEAQDMLREYVRSIYLWRCVDMIAQMASSITLDVEATGDRELTPAEVEIEELLAAPNPQWTGAALQYFISASLAVCNRAYLLRVRGNGDAGPAATLELWPLSADTVTIEYERDTSIIAAFTLNTGGTGRRFPVDPETGDCDVVYIQRPSLNRITDKSPAAVAAAPAEVFTRILQRCADIVSNSSNITGVLSTEQELAQKAVEDIKDRLSRYKTGAVDSGGTLVTANAKWALTRLSEDPAAALSVEIKDSLARDVCMTFGVPTQLVGIPGTDTYNNLALARVGFMTDTVLPGYVSLYVASLNQALTRDLDCEITPDIDGLPAMAAARLQLVETAQKATMLSINEQRELLGYPAFDDVDADVPVKLEEFRLKRLAVEAQAGNATGVLGGEPT